jgi:hypothetical protein
VAEEGAKMVLFMVEVTDLTGSGKAANNGSGTIAIFIKELFSTALPLATLFILYNSQH